MDKDLSLIIKNIRLPLAILIVIGHSDILHFPLQSGGLDVLFDASIIKYPITFLCRVLFSPSNALFFLISGYLFFGLSETFNSRVYLDKIKKRIKTLLIPYIIWQVIFLLPPLLSAVLGKSTPTPLYFIQSIWSIPGVSIPADPPLWFLRDLMVCMIISPVFYFILRRWWLAIPVFAFLLFIWILDFEWIPSINGLSLLSVLFFGCGAAIGVYKVDVIAFLRRFGAIGGGAFLIFGIWDMMTTEYVPLQDGGVLVLNAPYVNNMAQLFACVFYPYLVLKFCAFFNKINIGGSFAVYASHWGFLMVINAVFSYLLPLSISAFTAFLLFLLRVSTGVVGGLTVNWVLSRSGWLARFLAGGRL